MSIFFVGSYTEMINPEFGGSGEGIYSIKLSDKTGEINLLHTTPSVNPAYIAISDNNKFLYTITEVVIDKSPKIRAFKILEDYSLQFINEEPIEGSLPCHIEFANNCLFVACYGTGNLICFPTNKSGGVLAYTQNFMHSGKSINPERQEGPHAHQTCIHPDGSNIFVPDLGLDIVKAYKLDICKLTEDKAHDIYVTKGGGPRHMVFNKQGDIGYLINELTGNISVLRKEENKFILKKTFKSLPDSFKEVPSASAIRIHPNDEFLYAANRNLDAIIIFKIYEEDLQLLGYKFTKGKTLREFNITPDGKWLIACHQDSNDTIVYQIASNGELTEKHRTHDIISPVCIRFL